MGARNRTRRAHTHRLIAERAGTHDRVHRHGGAGGAEPLAFSVPPSLSAADRAIAPAVEVEITDEYGNRVATTAQITVALAPGSSGSLTGRSVGHRYAGTATFGRPADRHRGHGYRLVASSPGLASATSDPFDIVAGGAAVMAIFQGNGQTAAAGSAVPVPPAVKLLDANGNPGLGCDDHVRGRRRGHGRGGSATTDADGVAPGGRLDARSGRGPAVATPRPRQDSR